MRRVILFIFSERAVWGVGGGGYAARLFLLFSFACSADHERDWPPCKVVFRVGNQYAECEKQQQQQQQQCSTSGTRVTVVRPDTVVRCMVITYIYFS